MGGEQNRSAGLFGPTVTVVGHRWPRSPRVQEAPGFLTLALISLGK